MARLFLGLDSSTQSLSAMVIDLDSRRVVYEKSLNFDRTLPHYQTQNSVLPNADPLVKHSPPLMWAEALDLMFAEMKKDGVALGEILAISGSGQQHGSVCFNHRAAEVLERLKPQKSLVENLRGIFSRATAPIWMDSSTATECAEIRAALGGIKATAQATGSDAFERFTGPQIRKFFKTEPDAYAKTSSIALVSSFMASLLAGKIVPIDHGDGAGMNLMDIRKKIWHAAALKATAPNLKSETAAARRPRSSSAKVSPYFVRKFGVNPDAQIQVWSGDNPCSVIGLGLIKPGRVAISLGTSDTFFGTDEKVPHRRARRGPRFRFADGRLHDADLFQKRLARAGKSPRTLRRSRTGTNSASCVAATPPGNHGGILLPWFEAEIVPRVNQPGIHRFDLDEKDAAANCRAIFEAQMMTMRLHSQWMKVSPEEIYATGGASNDAALLRVLADVMNCRVRRIEVSKSAALGAALRAAHGWLLARPAKNRIGKTSSPVSPRRCPAAKFRRTKKPRRFTTS